MVTDRPDFVFRSQKINVILSFVELRRSDLVNISFNNLRLKGDLEEREERLEKSYERDIFVASSYGIIIRETLKLIITMT